MSLSCKLKRTLRLFHLHFLTLVFLIPAVKSQCRVNEELRTCGPECPIRCDTLFTTVCCEAKCRAGCFCIDGYVFSKDLRCIPVDDCPKPGTVQFIARTISVNDSSGSVRIKVLRTNGTGGAITVSWRTQDITAIGGIDYLPTSGIFTMFDGQTEGYIEITIINGNQPEGNKSFRVTLFEASPNVIIGRNSSIIVTINDNDAKPGTVQFTARTISVNDSSGSVRIKVLRTNGTRGAITVSWRTQDITAIGGIDYLPTSGTLTIFDGQTEGYIEIAIIDGNQREGNKSFRVTLFEASPNVIIGRNSSIIVTINDNDVKPGTVQFTARTISVNEGSGSVRIKVLRTNGARGIITVSWRTRGITAIGGVDYLPTSGTFTMFDGQTEGYIEIAIIDNQREGNKTFQVRLFQASPNVIIGSNSSIIVTIIVDVITIIDGAPPGIISVAPPGIIEFKTTNITVPEATTTVALTVLRSGGTDGTVTVRYRTSEKTAVWGIDYIGTTGTVEFPSGVSERIIEISLLDDSTPETNKQFLVELFDPSSGATLGRNRVATITIIDNDARPGIIQFLTSRVTVKENDRVVSLLVVRIQGSNFEVSVKWRTEDRTAVAGRDYIGSTGTMVFADGVTQRSILVGIIDNKGEEPKRTFVVVLHDPQGGAILGPRTVASVDIEDDDSSPSIIQFRRRSTTIRESVRSVRVLVTRRANFRTEVSVRWRTIDRTAQNGVDFIGGEGNLTFTPRQRQKTITITILNDRIHENNEMFDILLFSPSSNAVLGVPARHTVEILDEDEDPAEFFFQETHLEVRKSDLTVRLTVIRTGSNSPGTVRWRTADGTAIAGRHYGSGRGILPFTMDDTHKFIDITIIDNRQSNPSRVFTVELFDPSPGNKVVDDPATVTILNDDLIAQDAEVLHDDTDVTTTTTITSFTNDNATTDDIPNSTTSAITNTNEEITTTITENITASKTSNTTTAANVSITTTASTEIMPTVFSNSTSTSTGLLQDAAPVPPPPKEVPEESKLFFKTTDIIVPLGQTFLEIIVTRREALEPVTILWRTIDGTAIHGVHYRVWAQLNRLSFKAHETEKTIMIEIVQSAITSISASFQIEIFIPFLDNGVVSGSNIATVTIEGRDELKLVQKDFSPDESLSPELSDFIPPVVTSCPRGQILKECARECPPSCDDWKLRITCHTAGFSCVRACFCRNGLVFDRANGRRCIRRSECGCPPGMVMLPCKPSCRISCEQLSCPTHHTDLVGGLLGGGRHHSDLVGGLLGGGTTSCEPGCACPPGTVINEVGGDICIPSSRCV